MDQVIAKVLPNESFPQRLLEGYNSFAFQRFLSTFPFFKIVLGRPLFLFFGDIAETQRFALETRKQWEELLQWFQNVSTRVKRKDLKLKSAKQ